MKSLQKRTIQFAAGAAALAVLIIATPRTGHALAAALVQVANTVAAPAVTQDVSKTASQLVILSTPLGQTMAAGQRLTLNEIIPGSGLASTSYVVPSGEHLVVTGMEVVNYDANGAMSLYMPVPGGLLGIENLYFATAGTQQFLFPSGLAYPSGTSVSVGNTSGAAQSAMGITVHGYLTAN
jgi:hypothetical protein